MKQGLLGSNLLLEYQVDEGVSDQVKPTLQTQPPPLLKQRGHAVPQSVH